MYSPAVITSKPAQQHLDDLKVQHGDVLNAMAMQRERLLAMQQEKDMQIKEQQVQAQDMEKERMKQETEMAKITAQSQKDTMDHQAKTEELGIKRDALNTV